MNKELDRLNIRHPKTYYFPFDDLPNNDNLCVIKSRYGSRGNHLKFTRFRHVRHYYMDDRYIQDYIPFEREFRIGVDWKRILGIREKILNDDCECRKIKNSKSCHYITRKDMPKLEKFAWKVFKKFNVEFTGIDIGMYNGKFIVIELNSAPTIGEVWANKLKNDLLEKYYARI